MTKRKKPDEVSTKKDIGTLFEVIALCVFIVNAVLMTAENKDLRIIGLLLIIANFLFFTGFILSRLPSETKRSKENAKEN